MKRAAALPLLALLLFFLIASLLGHAFFPLSFGVASMLMRSLSPQ
jgi:hypothetical protein